MGPEAGCTVVENLATKRNRSLDLPACSSNNNNNSNVGLLYLRTIKMVEKVGNKNFNIKL